MWESLGTWLVLTYAHDLYSQAVAGGQSVAASSPFTNYTAASVAYVLVIAVLVMVLVIGGLLIVNIGLMSKRPEDRIGHRTPSDVGILKENVWPEAPPELRLLPAEEDEDAVTSQEAAQDIDENAPRKLEEERRRRLRRQA